MFVVALRFAAILVMGALAALLVVTSASAVHDNGLFELEPDANPPEKIGDAHLDGLGVEPPVRTMAQGQASIAWTGELEMVLVTETVEATIVDVEVRDLSGHWTRYTYDAAGNRKVGGGLRIMLDIDGEDLDSFVEAIIRGDVYVNVHSISHPTGEIRGQVIHPHLQGSLTGERPD